VVGRSYDELCLSSAVRNHRKPVFSLQALHKRCGYRRTTMFSLQLCLCLRPQADKGECSRWLGKLEGEVGPGHMDQLGCLNSTRHLTINYLFAGLLGFQVMLILYDFDWFCMILCAISSTGTQNEPPRIQNGLFKSEAYKMAWGCLEPWENTPLAQVTCMKILHSLRPDVWLICEQPSTSWGFCQPEFVQLAELMGMFLTFKYIQFIYHLDQLINLYQFIWTYVNLYEFSWSTYAQGSTLLLYVALAEGVHFNVPGHVWPWFGQTHQDLF